MSNVDVPLRTKIKKIRPFEPRTEKQAVCQDAWNKGQNLVMNGSAGTGKTFVALCLALTAVFDKETSYDEVIIVRSIVPTRDIGFLPGDEAEKKKA